MSRNKSNWTFKDIQKFLREHGFALHHIRGSHYYFRVMQSGKLRMVHCQFHGKDAIHPKTLSSVIKQSGISKSEWLDK